MREIRTSGSITAKIVIDAFVEHLDLAELSFGGVNPEGSDTPRKRANARPVRAGGVSLSPPHQRERAGSDPPHRRCWTSGPDLGERRSSRLVAAPTESRLR